MAFENILRAVEDGVATVTVNRPDKLNALNAATIAELDACFAELAADDSVRVAIVTGAGEKAFSAGADIMEFRTGGGTREALKAFGERVRADQVWKPVIAAINGFCLGGGMELAMTCDIRIAAEHARFGQPEVNIGFMPGGGGTQRLPRFVPRAIASEMLLTGEMIDAQEAYRIGLVNKVVPVGTVVREAKRWAKVLSMWSAIPMAAILTAVNEGLEAETMEKAVLIEAQNFAALQASDDMQEGLSAFLEKRRPKFQDK